MGWDCDFIYMILNVLLITIEIARQDKCGKTTKRTYNETIFFITSEADRISDWVKEKCRSPNTELRIFCVQFIEGLGNDN